MVLDANKLEVFHREVRDPDPAVWEPACRRLGGEAGRDQASYGVMCELLTSSLRELRIRGLVAMREVASVKPREVLMFLADRIAEARVSYDPLILEAVFSVYPGFPGQLGRKAVSGYLADASEGVRAAATSALRYWPEWPDGTLYRLATDGSLLVRASLVGVLAELPDSLDKREALEVLREAPEPELSALLEEFVTGPASRPARTRPATLNEEQACEVLSSTRPTPLDVQRFEQTLIEEPEAALGLVREGLDEPGGALVLKQLGDLCRDRSLATLFRAWSRILSWQGGSGGGLMLQVMGILDSALGSRLLAPLRGFVKSCLEAVECENCGEIAIWARTRQAGDIVRTLWFGEHPDRLTLAREAHVQLDRLVEVGKDLDGFGLYQLSHLGSSLVGLAQQIEVACPRPERDLLLAVVLQWQAMVGRETERLLGGGDPE